MSKNVAGRTELYRMCENQSVLSYAIRVTNTTAQADALDRMLEETKPTQKFSEWDDLIAAPFRYPVPIQPKYSARFKPPYFGRNVWYGGFDVEAAAHEYSYHFLRQRSHLNLEDEERGFRTLLIAEADVSSARDLSGHPELKSIMDRKSYLKSYRVAEEAADYTGILYPSCRDPKGGLCAAMFEINCFKKGLNNQWPVEFVYNPFRRSVEWRKFDVLEIQIDEAVVN